MGLGMCVVYKGQYKLNMLKVKNNANQDNGICSVYGKYYWYTIGICEKKQVLVSVWYIKVILHLKF